MTEQELEPLRGRVAQLLNSRELVINIGSAAGVMQGMQFDVLDPKGENIEDPETGQILGSLGRSKVRLRVTAVREKMAIAKTFRRFRVNVGGLGPGSEFSKYFIPEEWVVQHETLRADDRDWSELDEEESYVKVGDPVVQVIAPEPETLPRRKHAG